QPVQTSSAPARLGERVEGGAGGASREQRSPSNRPGGGCRVAQCGGGAGGERDQKTQRRDRGKQRGAGLGTSADPRRDAQPPLRQAGKFTNPQHDRAIPS